MIANKVQIRRNVSLLQSRIKNPKAVSNDFGCQLFLVIKVSEDIGDFLKFRGLKGAGITDEVEDFSRNCVVLFKDGLGLRITIGLPKE